MADTKLPNNQQRKPASDEMLARRRLLKLGVYVPPAVMGMMVLGSSSVFAGGSKVSCSPKLCSPCKKHPHGLACKKKINKQTQHT